MFNQDERRITNAIKRAVNQWLDILKESVDERTPEDTKTLLWNNEITPARDTWNFIEWDVRNNTEYALFVEQGVNGKNYRYNKPKWNIFYVWPWARMFEQGARASEDDIRSLINNSI